MRQSWPASKGFWWARDDGLVFVMVDHAICFWITPDKSPFHFKACLQIHPDRIILILILILILKKIRQTEDEDEDEKPGANCAVLPSWAGPVRGEK